MIYTIERRQQVMQPIEQVFAFFANAANLDLLTPTWLHFQVRTPTPITMFVGTQIEYTIRWHRLPLRWLTEIVEWIPERRFVDMQRSGPYLLWHHTHRFEKVGNGTIIEDVVRYALPMGPIGRIAHALLVRRDVERVFDFRASRIQELMGR
jgi:ligand-binding SRPBCC domain-containing protein